MTAAQIRCFSRELTLTWRHAKDQDGTREMPTISKEEISNNINDLKIRWKDELPKQALEALDNLLVHAKKGTIPI